MTSAGYPLSSKSVKITKPPCAKNIDFTVSEFSSCAFILPSKKNDNVIIKFNTIGLPPGKYKCEVPLVFSDNQKGKILVNIDIKPVQSNPGAITRYVKPGYSCDVRLSPGQSLILKGTVDHPKEVEIGMFAPSAYSFVRLGMGIGECSQRDIGVVVKGLLTRRVRAHINKCFKAIITNQDNKIIFFKVTVR